MTEPSAVSPVTARTSPASQPRPKLGRRLLMFVSTYLGPSVLVGLIRVCRVTVRGEQHLRDLRQSGAPFMYALWHGRIFAPIVQHRGEGVAAMVSLHGDGELIARIMHRLGYQTVRGSSTRHGKQALKGMIQHLLQGGNGAVIPDGPTGPARRSKGGTVRIASAAGGAPILPVSYSCRPAIRFKSWDQFILPVPFISRVIIQYGEPLRVPANLTEETLASYQTQLDTCLSRVETEADNVLYPNDTMDKS